MGPFFDPARSDVPCWRIEERWAGTCRFNGETVAVVIIVVLAHQVASAHLRVAVSG